MNRPENPAYPTFLLIGVAKAGTTWIHQILHEHPEVFVPPAKDLKFFDRQYDLGLDWYSSHFSEGKEAKARGELTHDYYFSRDIAQRIYRDLPGVVLACCLREPIDRLISGYQYNKSTEYNRDMTFEEYVARPGILDHVRYLEKLTPFFDLFGSDRMGIFFFDDIKERPEQFCADLYRFLGVDADFLPPSFLTPINIAHSARIQMIARGAYRVAGVLRKAGLANLVGVVKRNRIVERSLYRELKARPKIDPRFLQRLQKDCISQYAGLEDLIGRKLPTSWYEFKS